MTDVLNISHFQFLEAEVHWMDDVNAIEILEEQVTSLPILRLFPRGLMTFPPPGSNSECDCGSYPQVHPHLQVQPSSSQLGPHQFFHRPTKLRLNEVYIEIYVM